MDIIYSSSGFIFSLGRTIPLNSRLNKRVFVFRMTKLSILSEDEVSAIEDRLQIDTKKARFLGRGSYADIYWLPNSKRVFKITRDQTDAQASQNLIGKRLTYIVNTYDVFKINRRFFGIVNEKLTPLGTSQKKKWADLRSIYENTLLRYGAPPLSQTGLTVAWAMEVKDIAFANMYGNDAEIFEEEFDMLLLFASELQKYRIIWKDWHSGNIMTRGRNQVISDLGGNTISPTQHIPYLL